MTAKLNLDTLRRRAAALARKFADTTSEKRHDQNFMRDFVQVFGIELHRMAWQYPVKIGGQTHWIDGLLPGLLLMEMKSAGEDMDAAYAQASGYQTRLDEKDAPKTIIVCDFARLHIYRLDVGDKLEIALADLPDRIDDLKFLAGYEAVIAEREQQANETAAEKMAGLHDAIKATGYGGKDLETYLVRLLFCLFADDTGLFGENGRFLDLLVNHTKADGTDLHGVLASLFDTLNKAEGKRPKNLPEHLARFPHVNGALFRDALAQCYFDEAARDTLIECARLDWGQISPAIFGSLFQAVMHFDGEAATAKTQKRREFGAHYTSEANILKAIKPLFLDGLRQEFDGLRRNPKRLGAFHDKLRGLHFFDPACGCGNFLVVAYRELRLLELEVIEALHAGDPNYSDLALLVRCDVDQFHGIEIDGSAAHIAKVALWLTDHQMNLKAQRLGGYRPRIPLAAEANIVCANALALDWEKVLPPGQCTAVMGNPPFVGYSYQNKAQKADMEAVFQGVQGAGVLDYVAAWHAKAARYIQANPKTPIAFVSTNSLCQGEQVAILWGHLSRQGIHIRFAHRTFRWSNEGRGVAAVHCVIVGFGLQKPDKPVIYDYGDDIGGEPTAIAASHINPYLVDAPTVFIEKRRKPVCQGVPEMVKGSQPTDGGNLLLSAEEVDHIRATDPTAAKYIRPFLGSEEFINNLPRFCLWLKDSTAADRKASPEIQRRMQAVKAMRLASPKIPTQKLADVPYLFGEIRQTGQPYLLIPRVSSENRLYVPIGYLNPDVVCGDANFMLPNATLYHFGILCSSFHNAWMRTTCGRLKSDYRYSNTIVYNNFPWPDTPSDKHKAALEQAAQAILDARKAEGQRCAGQGQACSLATLYAPGNLPADLLKAHARLDKAVDAAYGYTGKKDDAARVAFLFGLYLQLAT